LYIALLEEPELILQMLATAVPSISLASQSSLANRLAPFIPVVIGKDRLPDVIIHLSYQLPTTLLPNMCMNVIGHVTSGISLF
jgi:hypothetical protein